MNENKGRFKEGNTAAVKPKTCPYCHKPLDISVYIYIKPKNKKEPLKNGVENGVC